MDHVYQRRLGELLQHQDVVYPTNISLPNPGRAAPRIYLQEVDLSRAKADCDRCQGTRYRWLAVGISQLSPSPGISWTGKSPSPRQLLPRLVLAVQSLHPPDLSLGHHPTAIPASLLTGSQPNFSLCPFRFPA